MIDLKKNIKIHIKNNRWNEGSFPNTPEAEKTFTITKERFEKAIIDFLIKEYPALRDAFSDIP